MHENLKLFGKILALLFILNLLVFGASLSNGFAMLDDGLLIFENNAIRSLNLETLKIIFTSYDPELYIPLTIFTYQLDYLIAGLNPLMFHLTNLILHTFNAVLVTTMVMMLIKNKWIAIITGIAFAIHPLQTETVVWASARKDLLSGFFFLSALLMYLQYRAKRVMLSGEQASEQDAQLGVEAPSKHKYFYILSILFFFLGLFAKVSILVLPIILLLVDYLQHRKIDVKRIIEKIPYFALSIIFGIIALGGKTNIVDVLNPLEKTLLALKSISFYLFKFVAPLRLSVFYPQLSDISLMSVEFIIPMLITLGCIGWLFHAYKHDNRTVVFGLLFFIITLAPTFITPNKGGENVFFASDRYMYLPIIGILLIVIPVLITLFQKRSIKFLGLFGPLGIIGFLLASITMRQSFLWGDQIKLFDRAVARSPEFYLGYINRGAAEEQAGKLDAAYASFTKAISLNALGNTYGQLGQISARQGHMYAAIGEFKKGIEIDPTDPELHNGLGQVYVTQNQFDQAIAEYERALELMPSSSDNAYNKLARRIGPRRDRVLTRLGVVYGIKEEHKKAIEYYEQAIEENPYYADAYYNLAVAQGNTLERDAAIETYRKAINIDPKMIQAHGNLGILLANAGRREEAIAVFKNLIKIDPLNTLAHNALKSLGGL